MPEESTPVPASPKPTPKSSFGGISFKNIAIGVAIGAVLFGGGGTLVYNAYKAKPATEQTKVAKQSATRSATPAAGKEGSGSENKTGYATPPKQTTPPAPKEKCKYGTLSQKDGKEVCVFTINATDVPARLQVYAVQVDPTPMSLYSEIIFSATCAPEGGCLKFSGGTPVTSEEASGIDWRIVGSSTITISSGETVETNSIPVRKYQFREFNYNHPAAKICTAEYLYCYTLAAKYDKIN